MPNQETGRLLINLSRNVTNVTSMIRLHDTLRALVAENPLIQFGFRHGLLNLTKTAQYLKPLVEMRTKKGISVSALTMALSRLQREAAGGRLKRSTYHFDRINMHTSLCAYTFTISPETHKGVHRLYDAVQKANGYITISQGTSQITVIVQSQFQDRVHKLIGTRPRFTHTNVASVGIAFDETYVEVPGLIYIVLQQMMLLNINIIEVSSTYTELVLYVAEKDLKTAFEALEALFVQGKKG